MINPVGTLPLSQKHRVSQISFHPTAPYLAVQSHERSVEIFSIRTEEEIKKKMARRKRRAKEKKQEKGDKKGQAADDMDIDQDEDVEAPFIDKFTPHVVIRASGKVRSFNFAPESSGQKNAAQARPYPLTSLIPSSHVSRSS